MRSRFPAETSSDPASRARFEQEARAVAAVNHPNIVTIHSVEESGSTRFLTMEVVDGGTIDTLFLANGLPLPDLLKYALPIVDAGSAAHERGIVHRDLKPANVMVTDVPTGVGRHVFDKVCRGRLALEGRNTRR